MSELQLCDLTCINLKNMQNRNPQKANLKKKDIQNDYIYLKIGKTKQNIV